MRISSELIRAIFSEFHSQVSTGNGGLTTVPLSRV
jgi:hypothetical protein